MMPRDAKVQFTSQYWEKKDTEWRDAWNNEIKEKKEKFKEKVLREKKLQDLKDNELQVTYKVLLKQRNAFIQEIQDIFEEIKKNNYLNLLNTDLDRYQSTLKEEVETLSSMPKTIFHVMMSVRIFKELNNAANPMNFNPETFWEKQAHLGY